MLPERFVLSTSFTCSEIVRNRCIIPIPPSLAIATAIADSVTVSIFALITGMLREIFFESFVCRFV